MTNNMKKPLKVFILAGQSNMQGQAHISTFDHIGMDPTTAPILKEMLQKQQIIDNGKNVEEQKQQKLNQPRVCDNVYISSIGNHNINKEKEYYGKVTVGFGAKTGRGHDNDNGSNATKIGPEFTFGICMEKEYKQQSILLIKTAWGGTSLHTDFRSPSSGTYEFNSIQIEKMKKQGKNIQQEKEIRTKISGKYYQLMITHIRKVLNNIQRIIPDYNDNNNNHHDGSCCSSYEIAGFVWFQGWNDMVANDVYPNRNNDGGYDLYSKLLTQFIHDIRNDLSEPTLPFVIGVLGVGGPTHLYDGTNKQRYKRIHQNFRNAMAVPAESSILNFKDNNVVTVLTENYWDKELDQLKECYNKKMKLKSCELNNITKTNLTHKEREVILSNYKTSIFTKHELEILKGTSNAEYHYLGSGKIIAQIGKAFAQALIDIDKKRRRKN